MFLYVSIFEHTRPKLAIVLSPPDESVYVADAGAGLPTVRSPRGGHIKKSPLSHHALHSAAGEAGRRNGT